MHNGICELLAFVLEKLYVLVDTAMSYRNYLGSQFDGKRLQEHLKVVELSVIDRILQLFLNPILKTS